RFADVILTRGKTLDRTRTPRPRSCWRADRKEGIAEMATIELLAPVEAVAGNAVPLAKRVPTLEGRVVGLLNNSKAGTRPFLDRVEELLRSAHGVSRIIRYDKRAAALPVPDEMLEAAARECEVVINGIADCGSCT